MFGPIKGIRAIRETASRIKRENTKPGKLVIAGK